MVSRDAASPSPAHFIGALAHRGRLAASSREKVASSIWVPEPALVGLGGWQLEVETGDEEAGEWTPRKRWMRVGEGEAVEVVQER